MPPPHFLNSTVIARHEVPIGDKTKNTPRRASARLGVFILNFLKTYSEFIFALHRSVIFFV